MNRLITRGFDHDHLILTRGLDTGGLFPWDALKLNWTDYYDILDRLADLNFDKLSLSEVNYGLILQEVEL